MLKHLRCFWDASEVYLRNLARIQCYDVEFSETMAKSFKKADQENKEQKITRVKLPRGKEVIGVIDQRLGGNKMMVSCTDGKTRNCRVPGRLKRALWLRPGDVVIIEPWELDNEKGDVIFKYRPNQVAWLRKNGYLEKESNEF